MTKPEVGFPTDEEVKFRVAVLNLSKNYGLTEDRYYYNLCFMVAASVTACGSFGMRDLCYSDAMKRIRMYINLIDEMKGDAPQD